MTGAVPAWSGRRVQKARQFMVSKLPSNCARCGKTITIDDRWVIGHVKSRAAYPELTWEPSNWRHEHRKCSDKTGQQAVIEKAAATALATGKMPVFPASPAQPQSPPRPVSLPGSNDTAGNGAVSVPERLAWNARALAKVPWLQGLCEPPADAAPPLLMSPPHPRATGSYGPDAIRWIEKTQKIKLRWWQALAITRQLEHDESGALVWRVIVESAPRRAGKSVRLRGVALWRLEHGAKLFGEPQLVVHSGKDVSIVREIQRAAWRWAEDDAGTASSKSPIGL